MAYFPMFVQLKKKKCLVIGGGKIALRKIEVLKDFEADITVIAPEMITQIRQIDQICRIFRTFMEKDFNEADFVIAATDDQKTNHEISQICRRKKIPVNAVDQKEDCSFIFPSYVKEGEVVAAFSSGGQSPLITQYLKEKIKPDLNKELGQLAQILGSLRKLAKSCIATEQERKAFYKELLQIGLEDIDSLEEQRINEIIQKYISERNRGTVKMERTRRLRISNYMRDMVRENHVRIDELIYPIFVTEGENIKHPVESMPGIYQYSLDRLSEEINRIKEAGIKAILIFGIPDHKDEVGSGAYAEDGIVPKAIRQIKKEYEELLIIADVCLCEYTSHGHCGLVKDGVILNDETLPLLAKASVSYAKAGADIIAPSDMMDLRVKAIREALDEAGFVYTPIMSYSAKFASGYYGPFRDAAHSAPGFGDRKTYQMDPANGQEALREIGEDIEEGADLIIAKPALAYMDIMKEASMKYNIPIVAYNVSGEYAMVKAAAANGWIDEKKIVMENMVGLKRAGAKMIITYHALDVAKWLKEEER